MGDYNKWDEQKKKKKTTCAVTMIYTQYIYAHVDYDILLVVSFHIR